MIEQGYQNTYYNCISFVQKGREIFACVKCMQKTIKKYKSALASVAQWLECCPVSERLWFDFLPGHMSVLQVRYPIWAQMMPSMST